MPARSKYGAIPTTVDGIRFASKREANRYAELRQMERGGLIANLTIQPEFPIVIDGRPLRIATKRGQGRPIKPRMDFAYFRDGARVVEDSKGFDNPNSRLKRALVEHLYHVRIELT